jgi:hypothetical protein
LSIVDFFNKCEYKRSIHIFPDLPHKHQSIICHRLLRLMLRYRQLLPLLQHCHRLLRLMLRYRQLLRLMLRYRQLLRLMLRYRQLLPLLRLRHHYHYDDSDDHNDSSFYVRTRTADLTLLS